MTTPTPVMDQLEQIVDRIGTKNTIELLAMICDLKASHIEENWQDKPLARTWSRFAKILDVVATKIED